MLFESSCRRNNKNSIKSVKQYWSNFIIGFTYPTLCHDFLTSCLSNKPQWLGFHTFIYKSWLGVAGFSKHGKPKLPYATGIRGNHLTYSNKYRI